MGVPPTSKSSILLYTIFHYKPSILGYPNYLWKPPNEHSNGYPMIGNRWEHGPWDLRIPNFCTDPGRLKLVDLIEACCRKHGMDRGYLSSPTMDFTNG